MLIARRDQAAFTALFEEVRGFLGRSRRGVQQSSTSSTGSSET